jgi:hypothetical protein
MGTGTIQNGGGRDAELQNRLVMRLADAMGRQLGYNNLGQSARQPDAWKEHMALVDEAAAKGIQANPLCTPHSTTQRFTMRNAQVFWGIPTSHPILLPSDTEKLQAYRDPEIRKRLHDEVVECKADITIFDPDIVVPLPDDVAQDFRAGSWRVRELASGIHYSIVNG